MGTQGVRTVFFMQFGLVFCFCKKTLILNRYTEIIVNGLFHNRCSILTEITELEQP